MAAKFLIGIDEAGRGPLAGPISVGAFAVKLRASSSQAALKNFCGVKDSKQLSEKQREEWFVKIKSSANVQRPNVFFTVSFSSAKLIDKKGLTYATKSALNRCLKKLEKKIGTREKPISLTDSLVLLDGSLYAPEKYKNQKTIIDGDAKEPIIALASICAKVLRDRKMKKLTEKYPAYHFEVHKGYGTRAHYRAIKRYGISDIHRRSFLKGLK